MRIDTGPLQGPARKRTKVLSNSYEVLKRVEARCPNSLADKSLHHQHVPLEQGRATLCHVYPRVFCSLVVGEIAAETRLRSLPIQLVPLISIDAAQAAGEDANGILH